MFHKNGFGEFQFQTVGRDRVLLHGVADKLHQFFLVELMPGNIDRHISRVQVLGAPRIQLGASGFNDPLANLQYEPILFRNGDEITGGNPAFFRMIPANKSLQPDKLSSLACNFWIWPPCR